VDVVFVVPEGKCNDFKLGAVTSQLNDWGWTPGQECVAGFARSQA